MEVEDPRIREVIDLLVELDDDLKNKRHASLIHDSTAQARRLLLDIARGYE